MEIKLSILYQAQATPAVDGIVKPMKERGYMDSGADIAVALRQMRVSIITPSPNPSIKEDKNWVFPDTKEGIQAAIDKGANTFWLNTVLYQGHAIEAFTDQNIYVVGQTTDCVQTHDDKWYTNQVLRKHKLPLSFAQILKKGSPIPSLSYPIIIKPLRGRGSQGVQLIQNKKNLNEKLDQFFSNGLYGNKVILEKFLSGQEITLTVIPPGVYHLYGNERKIETHWSLHPVIRVNHENGIAPYSGKVVVTANSFLMPKEEAQTQSVQTILQQCAYAAELIQAKAPIRIDCRADENGIYRIFDVNLKPNMTGASRPHRMDQDSLSVIAARTLEWTYSDFVWNVLQQRWLI